MPILLAIVGGIVVLGFLLIFVRSITSTAPTNLGIVDHRLAPAPSSPNCVLTQTDSAEHRIAPFELQVSVTEAMNCLKQIIGEQANATIVATDEHYLHAEFRSRLFRFVDDAEFYVSETDGVVHLRSASRTGYSDMGVNRDRIEKLRIAFRQCCQ